MTRPPDPHELARRFLDLWQDHLQAMATDPEVADAMRRWSTAWTGMLRPVMPTARPDETADGLQPGYRPAGDPSYDAGERDWASEGSGEHGRTGQQRVGGRRPTAAGSAAAAAVSEHRGDDLALVLRELRRLEERIARLEAGIEGGGEQPEKPARSPRGGARRGRG